MDQRQKAKTAWERWDDEELERELLPWPDTIQVTLTEQDVKLMRHLAKQLRGFHDAAHGRECTCQNQLLKEAVERLRTLSDAWVAALEADGESSEEDECDPKERLLLLLALHVFTDLGVMISQSQESHRQPIADMRDRIQIAASEVGGPNWRTVVGGQVR